MAARGSAAHCLAIRHWPPLACWHHRHPPATATLAADLEAHVNAHFDDSTAAAAAAAAAGGFDDDDEVQIVEDTGPEASSAPTASVPCPQCGTQLAAHDLDSHLLAHQLEQEELQQLEAGVGERGAAAAAAQEEQDAAAAAALAAAEWGDDAGAGAGGGSSEDDAVHAAALEDAYFQVQRGRRALPVLRCHMLAQPTASPAGNRVHLPSAPPTNPSAAQELRAKYGFEAAPRQGACRVCQQQEHWARECPQNPDVVTAAARVLAAPTPAAIAASQQQARGTRLAGPGLVQMLAGCLEAAAPHGAAGAGYAAALCAPGVQHFPSTLFCSGWWVCCAGSGQR